MALPDDLSPDRDPGGKHPCRYCVHGYHLLILSPGPRQGSSNRCVSPTGYCGGSVTRCPGASLRPSEHGHSPQRAESRALLIRRLAGIGNRLPHSGEVSQRGGQIKSLSRGNPRSPAEVPSVSGHRDVIAIPACGNQRPAVVAGNDQLAIIKRTAVWAWHLRVTIHSLRNTGAILPQAGAAMPPRPC